MTTFRSTANVRVVEVRLARWVGWPVIRHAVDDSTPSTLPSGATLAGNLIADDYTSSDASLCAHSVPTFSCHERLSTHPSLARLADTQPCQGLTRLVDGSPFDQVRSFANFWILDFTFCKMAELKIAQFKNAVKQNKIF
jgi:hypothetical protein